MTVVLPFSPLPGADKPNSLAEAQQANNDALALATDGVGVANAIMVCPSQPGPLPLNGTFTAPAAGDYVFVGFASAWLNVAGAIAIGFGINTTATQAQARLYGSEANSHKSLVPAVWAVTLAAGSHSWNIHIDTVQTNADSADVFAIVAMRIP